MKQRVSPAVVLVTIAVAVLVFSVGALWIWRAPSVSAGKPVSRAEVNAAMRQSHTGPTTSEMQQIQDWKKQHPGSYTKY